MEARASETDKCSDRLVIETSAGECAVWLVGCIGEEMTLSSPLCNLWVSSMYVCAGYTFLIATHTVNETESG